MIKMFEVGMSALVQRICNEYAQKNGYNFPPNTQQMINAIVEWVNTQAIRNVTDIKIISQTEVKEGIEYTAEVEYSKGANTTFKFVAPMGTGIKNIKIVELGAN